MLVRLSFNPIEAEVWRRFFQTTTDEFGCEDIEHLLKARAIKYTISTTELKAGSRTPLPLLHQNEEGKEVALTYLETFKLMLEEGNQHENVPCTLLGLYRPTGTKGSFMPFAHTNPPPGMRA